GVERRRDQVVRVAGDPHERLDTAAARRRALRLDGVGPDAAMLHVEDQEIGARPRRDGKQSRREELESHRAERRLAACELRAYAILNEAHSPAPSSGGSATPIVDAVTASWRMVSRSSG